MYLPSVIWSRPWSDDFPMYYERDSLSIQVLRDSRPLYSLLINSFGTLGLSIDFEMRLLRLISFLFLGLIYLSATKLMRHNSGILAMLLGFASPAMHFVVNWATGFIYAITMFLSWFGFHFIINNITIFRKILGGILLICAWLSYPPLALFGLCRVIIMLLDYESREPKPSTNVTKNKTITSVYLTIPTTALISYLIAVLIIEGVPTTQSSRTKIIPLDLDSVKTQSIWFFSRPLLLMFYPFKIERPDTLLNFVVILSVVALYMIGIFQITSKERRVHVFICSILPIGIFFPIDYKQVELRFFIASQFCVLLVLVYGIARRTEVSILIGKTQKMFFLVTLFVAIILFNNRWYQDVYSPQVVRDSFITSQIASCIDEEGRFNKIIYIEPRTQDWEDRNRLGMFSQQTDLQSEWVPKYAVKRITETLLRRDILIEFQHSVNMKEPRQACTIELDNYPPDN
jgi:hypothetical protein